MEQKADIEKLLAQHHHASYGWAMACCQRNVEEAKETLQITYLKILEGKAVPPPPTQFKAWIFRVIRNTAIDLQRKRSVRTKLRIQFSRNQKDLGPTTLDVEQGQQAELAAAMKKLSKRQTELLHLVFYQGQTLAEAADILGLSLGTARTHYARAKEKLRLLLQSSGSSK
ncbi:MAG: RNA polymerase sigma factor [Saprospiraceae bacterium]|nr:RNA polymerase sigma factor [Saprospiraceae bacterium]